MFSHRSTQNIKPARMSVDPSLKKHCIAASTRINKESLPDKLPEKNFASTVNSSQFILGQHYSITKLSQRKATEFMSNSPTLKELTTHFTSPEEQRSPLRSKPTFLYEYQAGNVRAFNPVPAEAATVPTEEQKQVEPHVNTIIRAFCNRPPKENRYLQKLRSVQQAKLQTQLEEKPQNTPEGL